MKLNRGMKALVVLALAATAFGGASQAAVSADSDGSHTNVVAGKNWVR